MNRIYVKMAYAVHMCVCCLERWKGGGVVGGKNIPLLATKNLHFTRAKLNLKCCASHGMSKDVHLVSACSCRLIDSGSPISNQSDISHFHNVTGKAPTSLHDWIAGAKSAFQ